MPPIAVSLLAGRSVGTWVALPLSTRATARALAKVDNGQPIAQFRKGPVIVRSGKGRKSAGGAGRRR